MLYLCWGNSLQFVNLEEITVKIHVKLIAEGLDTNILNKLGNIIQSLSSNLERSRCVALQSSQIKISNLVDIGLHK